MISSSCDMSGGFRIDEWVLLEDSLIASKKEEYTKVNIG